MIKTFALGFAVLALAACERAKPASAVSAETEIDVEVLVVAGSAAARHDAYSPPPSNRSNDFGECSNQHSSRRSEQKVMAPGGSYVSGSPRMAPDGTYVGGEGAVRMAPDGTYVSGNPRMAPDGTYVGGEGAVRMAPDGTYVSGNPRMAPDGTYVGGRPSLAPDGTYVGVSAPSQ